jgi:hypothetical protein
MRTIGPCHGETTNEERQLMDETVKKITISTLQNALTLAQWQLNVIYEWCCMRDPESDVLNTEEWDEDFTPDVTKYRQVISDLRKTLLLWGPDGERAIEAAELRALPDLRKEPQLLPSSF